MTIITVVIPYHHAHATVVKQAVASCLFQSFQDFEVIVVNDSPLPNHKFVSSKVRTVSSYGQHVKKNRAAVARNYGTKFANSDFVVYLDADDYLLPRALEVLLRGHLLHNRTYTFSSHYNGGHHMRPPDYSQEKYKFFNIHPITCLIPTNAVRDVGGFDEDATGWEDWTLYLRLAIKGYCGEFVRGPIFVYRDEHSINHKIDVQGGLELMEQVIAPYKKNGDIVMAACCGGGDRTNVQRVVSSMSSIGADDSGLITLEYTGDMQGTATWRHPVSKRLYRAGRNPANRIIRVSPEDVSWLEQFKFRRIMPEQPLVPPPVDAPTILEESSSVEDVQHFQLIDILTDEQVEEYTGTGKKRGRKSSN